MPRYDGEVTPTLLQMFVREHGADKPKGAEVEPSVFSVQCDTPLPYPPTLRLVTMLSLRRNAWRDLMQQCGYEPPAKKPTKPPLLNLKAPSGELAYVCPHRREVAFVPQVEMTKAEFANIHTDQRGTRLAT